MKQFLFFFLFISLSSIGSQISLSSNSTTVYSCDTNINQWMINNIKYIENYSLDDILEKEPSFHKTIFSALSAESKSRIINEKLDFILTQDWNHIQQALILEFQSFITKDLYENKQGRERLENWLEKAKKSFTDEDLAYVAYTLNKTKAKMKVKNVKLFSPPCECSRQFVNANPCGMPPFPGEDVDTTQCGISLCALILSACGPGSAYDCNGMCLPVVNM